MILIYLGVFITSILVIGAFGQTLLGRFITIDDHFYRFCFGLLCGLLCISFCLLIVGAIGWLYPLAGYVVLLMMFLTGLRELRALLGHLGHAVRAIPAASRQAIVKYSASPPAHKAIKAGIVLLGILILLILFLASFAPPTGWDAINYHLAVPKIYLQQHRIVLTPSIWHSHLPLLVQFQYLFFMLLGFDSLAQVLNLFLGILVLGCLYKFQYEAVGKFSAWLSVVLMATIPVFLFILPDTQIEASASLYVMLAAIAGYKYLQNRNQNWFVLFAIATASLGGSKYSNVSYMVAFWVSFLALLAYQNYQKQKQIIWTGIYKKAGLLLIAALVIAMPWYLKTWIETGNPIWPYQLDGWSLSAAGNPNMSLVEGSSEGTVHIAHNKIARLVMAPVLMTFFPDNLGGDSPKIGPLILGLLPFLLFSIPRYLKHKVKHRQLIVQLGIVLLISHVAWSLLFMGTRYFLPMLPVLIMCIAMAVAYTYDLVSTRRRSFLAAILGMMVLISLAYNGLIVYKRNFDKIPVALGAQSREEFLLNSIEPGSDGHPRVWEYGVSQFANQTLTTEDKILCLGEFRGYYLDIDYMWGRPDFQTVFDYSTLDNRDSILSAWRSEGITHVITTHSDETNDDRRFAYEDAYDIIDQDILPRYARLQYNARGHSLYELDYEAAI